MFSKEINQFSGVLAKIAQVSQETNPDAIIAAYLSKKGYTPTAFKRMFPGAWEEFTNVVTANLTKAEVAVEAVVEPVVAPVVAEVEKVAEPVIAETQAVVEPVVEKAEVVSETVVEKIEEVAHEVVTDVENFVESALTKGEELIEAVEQKFKGKKAVPPVEPVTPAV